jgi:dTDP-4-dehydrorhamnose reductase
MKTLVLGHRGMLGHVVCRRLAERQHEIVTVTERFSAAGSNRQFKAAILDASADCWVNCIGLRPSASTALGELLAVNAALPRLLVQSRPARVRLIHASTDGVFVADQPNRLVSDSPDAEDGYGQSKALGEAAVLAGGGMVLRCSMIGPELGRPRSLLGWLLTQTGLVNGYANHMWNGITSLEWADQCHALLQSGYAGQCRQPGFLPAISKHELLSILAEIWALPVRVSPLEAQTAVTRTLIPQPLTASIREQLQRLHDWYGQGAVDPMGTGRPALPSSC